MTQRRGFLPFGLSWTLFQRPYRSAHLIFEPWGGWRAQGRAGRYCFWGDEGNKGSDTRGRTPAFTGLPQGMIPDFSLDAINWTS